jgi:4-amino-4-deoxy-L-arabinose transferase-like glycosyltransferase
LVSPLLSKTAYDHTEAESSVVFGRAERAATEADAGVRSNRWAILESPGAMIVAALALRLVVMAFVYDQQLVPWRDHFTFGYETGRIARSIATGRGFSSPYPEPSGPTALLAPVYPYLLAGIFRLFGIYTAGSALAILFLNNLFSSLTCLPVFWIARRAFGARVSLWAGWIWAFFPYSVAISNLWVWETSLTTLLLTVLLAATLYLERPASPVAWGSYGILWGVAALTSPATLSVLPFLGLWLLVRHRQRGTRCAGRVVVASLVFVALVAPWLWRDHRVFGRFVAFRSGFPLEFLVGNNDDAGRLASASLLPADNSVEMARFLGEGEPAYMEEKQREVRRWISHRPLRFLGLTVRRVVYTWTGLWDLRPQWVMDVSGFPYIFTNIFISFLAFIGLRRAIRAGESNAIPLVIPLIFFPLIYYVTHPDIRYRHPIDPMIVIFIAYGLVSLREHGKGEQFRAL